VSSHPTDRPFCHVFPALALPPLDSTVDIHLLRISLPVFVPFSRRLLFEGCGFCTTWKKICHFPALLPTFAVSLWNLLFQLTLTPDFALTLSFFPPPVFRLHSPCWFNFYVFFSLFLSMPSTNNTSGVLVLFTGKVFPAPGFFPCVALTPPPPPVSIGDYILERHAPPTNKVVLSSPFWRLQVF